MGNKLWRYIEGAPIVALAITVLAWLSIAVAFTTGDVAFTLGFLLLGATAPCVALFSVVVDRRPGSFVALLLTLIAPVATLVYVSTRPYGWLS